MILAAIEKSDGTRKGVTEQVFSGAGITIPADKSVIGKEINIDPTTGDTNNKDISILLMKGGKETFLKPWSCDPQGLTPRQGWSCDTATPPRPSRDTRPQPRCGAPRANQGSGTA